MILNGKIVAENIDIYVKNKINENIIFYKNKYIAFLLFEENISSRTYIKMKEKKAKSFWLQTKVIEDVNLKDFEKAINIIDDLNNDENCIWILIQLPINKYLQPHQWKILAHISPKKDIDGLGWVLFGLSQIEAINFLPATVRAIFEILNFYKVSVSWKNVAILWQSNLIWKPTATECMKQQATVFSFNEFSTQEEIKKICKISDIIISATWKLHLVDKNFISEEKMQVLIDVGWGTINGKASWDFNFENIDTDEHMYTPVPGGVWPVTVSSIFANLVDLQEIL